MRPIILLLAFLGLTAISNAQTPTWSDNVACIVYQRCYSCHYQGGPTPFSLKTYSEAFLVRNSMKSAVQARRMPPWPADPAYRTHAKERYLTQAEVNLIANWVDAGAPEGNPANAPAPPVINTGSQIGTVSWTGKMANYVNPLNQEDYRCFVVPLNNAQAVYLSAMEVIPGNREMVHHCLVYADNTGVPAQLDANDPLPGYTNFGGTGSQDSKFLGGWVPGGDPIVYPPGMGMKLEPNSVLVLQMHYPINTQGKLDSTRVNLKFASGTTREVMNMPILNHVTTITQPLVIPANTVRSFTAEYTIPYNTTLLSVMPHMHLIGKSIKIYAVPPVGDTIRLVDVPKWDFSWQGTYSFRKPVILPVNSLLKAEAVYDNTANNPNNPSNPPQTVTAGEATTDEMLIAYFSFLIPSFASDANIVIDTDTIPPGIGQCLVLSNPEQPGAEKLNLYPNPASYRAVLQIPMQWENPEIRLTDAQGRELPLSYIRIENELHLSSLPESPGIYTITLLHQGSTWSGRLSIAP